MFTYIVRCTCKDEALAEEWMSWMREEHLVEVCEAGALEGEVIRLESGPGTNTTTCEVHYHFASRQAFNAYQRDHAPRLSAEGLRRFPTERGMSYQRSVGEVVAREVAREEAAKARGPGGSTSSQAAAEATEAVSAGSGGQNAGEEAKRPVKKKTTRAPRTGGRKTPTKKK